ncbi:Leucine aminopeptidase 1 [Thoreauomyces humboldtii]|nr:Leucine aminopeptidase 1 [Thoreauomyces humboldtii]
MHTRSISLFFGAAAWALLTTTTSGLPLDQKVLISNDDVVGDRRLIATSETVAEWLTEEEVFGLIRETKHFVDITDGDLAWGAPSVEVLKSTTFPSKPNHAEAITPLLASVSIPRMTKFLTTLSDFHTRYYKSKTGAAAAEWIESQAAELAYDANEKGTFNVTVDGFAHSWGQQSVIARIEPVGEWLDDRAVIISAHLDSVNQWNPYFGRSPGADDDGSGTATIFEVYTILLASDLQLVRPIEFHFYSAEEGGLLGSQKVVSHYVSTHQPVLAQLQVDMTGFTPDNAPEILGIATDYVDPKLSKFLQIVAEKYCEVKWGDVACGYGCSDHATWTKAGYPAAFTFEAPFELHNPAIHTANDDLTHISWNHMSEFVKLALAFGVELGLTK